MIFTHKNLHLIIEELLIFLFRNASIENFDYIVSRFLRHFRFSFGFIKALFQNLLIAEVCYFPLANFQFNISAIWKEHRKIKEAKLKINFLRICCFILATRRIVYLQ